MSRKLGVLVLAMGMLVGAMGLKSALATHAKGAVISASGVSPVPPPPKQNGPKT